MNEPPSQLGPYRVQGLIAKGGMGAVYAAVDAYGQRVALKTCLRVSPHATKRMQREVRALQRVVHPNVVHLLDSGAGPPPWLAMEWIEGSTLAELARSSAPSLERTLRVLEDLAAALVELHALGIVHRDLKPENVMLRASSGSAVLCDFGINRGDGDETLTATGGVIGTFDFMAPEQINGERAGPPADVWGLGGLLYWQLNSQPPNRASLRPLELEHATRELRRDVQALCDRCLAIEPDARPSAAEVHAALRRLRGARGTPSPRRGFRGSWVAALLIPVVALAATLAWFLRDAGPPAAPPSTPVNDPAPADPDPLAAARPWTSVWRLGEDPLQVTDERQWPTSTVVDPLSAPRASFAGEVVPLDGGVLQVSYALADLPLFTRHPERYRALRADRPPAWVRAGAQTDLEVPWDGGGVAIPIGWAHWQQATLEVRLAGARDEARNPAALWAGLAPYAEDHGVSLTLGNFEGPQRATLGEAFTPFDPADVQVRLAPAESPWVRVSGQPLQDVREERAREGQFVLLPRAGRWRFSGPAVVVGRPTRVDRPGLAQLPQSTETEARLRATVHALPTATAGPFVGVRTSSGAWARLEVRGSELWLYSETRLLGRAPLPDADSELPLELSLWRRGVVLRGVVRRGAHLASVERVWAQCGSEGVRWTCGSSGPRAEFAQLSLEQTSAELAPQVKEHASLAQAVDALLHGEQLAATARDEKARELRAALQKLVPKLLELPLRADALARAIYCSCVLGEGDLAAELTAQLVAARGSEGASQDLRALDDDVVTGLDLIGQLTLFAPGYSGISARRCEAGQRVVAVLGGASPEELAAVAHLLRLVGELRAGKKVPSELSEALENAPGAPAIERAEALSALGRKTEALHVIETESKWRTEWFPARHRSMILAKLGRQPEALEASLFALGQRPRKAIARTFFSSGALTPTLAKRLRPTHPGLSAAASLVGDRLRGRSNEESARSLGPTLAIASEDPRQRDLQAFVRASLGLPGDVPSGDRPTAVLARAVAGDEQARAQLREAASQDDLVFALARVDQSLWPLLRK